MLICSDCRVPLNGNEQCQECGWEVELAGSFPVFLSTADKNNPNFRNYQANYDQICEDDLSESMVFEDYLQSQANKLFDYCKDVGGQDICEIGIGRGLLFDQLLMLNPNRLLGIDISAGYLEKYRSLQTEQLQVFVSNAENLPFKNCLDLIISCDVLEHVFNVGDFLYSVNQALRVGGKFIVRVPYNEDLSQYAKLRGCKYDFVHLRNFTKSSLRSVINGAGMKVNKIYSDGFIVLPQYKRKWLTKMKLINYLFDKYVEEKYTSIYEINKTDNILRRMFLKPIEITAVCEKVEDL